MSDEQKVKMLQGLSNVEQVTQPKHLSPMSASVEAGMDEKEEKGLTLQISVTGNSDGNASVGADNDTLEERITDADGNLTYNRTQEEKEHDDKIEKRLTQLANDSKECSFNEWEALLELQCPLPPRKYKYFDKQDNIEKSVHTTARLYQGKFWIRHPDSGIIYEAITKEKDIKKNEKRLNQMRAVDEYLQAFKLTTSVQIYKRFKKAVGFLEDSKMKKSDKKKQEIAYKLIPGWTDRLSFFGTLTRALLNAYFIYFNLQTAFQYNNAFYFWGILITAGAEAYLFFVALSRTLYNTKSLVERLLENDTVHFQTKNMPMQIREMASTSILRFLPSGESTNRLRKRYKEWWDELLEDYRFAVENARKHKLTVKIRESLNIVFIIIGPLLAVLALIFKVSSLELEPQQLFGKESYTDTSSWLLDVFIPYLGFVNQIAGIRKVRLIEMNALQHFVFSGNDVKLSKHERQMMNVWWNFTVVSCVSNICDKFQYPTFDSIVFWYHLNPRKLQILLKNHDAEGVDFLQTRMKKGKRVIQTTPRQDYDKEVFHQASKRELQKKTQSMNDMITQMDSGVSEDADDDTNIATTKVYQSHSHETEKKDDNDNENDENKNDDDDDDDNDNVENNTANRPV